MASTSDGGTGHASASVGGGHGGAPIKAVRPLAVHCGGPEERGHWALLYINTARPSDHTRIRVSADMHRIMGDVEAAHTQWGATSAVPSVPAGAGAGVGAGGGAGAGAGAGGAEDWQLALCVGRFEDRASAETFCLAWADRCRGAISRVARAETLAHRFGLAICGDLRVIFRDARAYDFIKVVGRAR